MCNMMIDMGSMMWGVMFLGGLVSILTVIALVLLIIWLYKQIQKK